jgi:NADH-quinone oxidoreductase subunit L
MFAAETPGWFLEHAWLVPLIPGIAFALIILVGKRVPDIKLGRFTIDGGGSSIGIASMVAALVIAAGAAIQWISYSDSFHGERVPPVRESWVWWQAGGLEFGLGQHIDGLAVMALLLVAFISTLVQIYSLEYLRGDRRYTHFFAAITLFSAGMLVMVLAENMVQLILGWEIMGLCSFMLIGHWWEDEANARAALKAFFTVRVGDIGLLVGTAIVGLSAQDWVVEHGLQDQYSGFSIEAISRWALSGDASSTVLLWGAVALFIAAIGKSGQFPLHTWLPDAMAGPTPVSSLLHSSTMVVAGVFLVARLYPVFFEGLKIMDSSVNLIAVIGGITIIVAAALAFVQIDIKRVLAYSTVSQLGYMMMGLGVGAWTPAVFHIWTHAFFKCCLFLCAGSVSHSASHHSFDMKRDMGGLRKYMPVTFVCWVVSSMALAGVPLFSGWFSKDEIIDFAGANQYKVFMLVGIVGAFMTTAYMTRATYLVFFGEPRGNAAAALAGVDHVIEGYEPDAAPVPARELVLVGVGGAGMEDDVSDAGLHEELPEHDDHGGHHGHEPPHESPWLIKFPLITLGVLAVFAGLLNAAVFGDSWLRFEHWVQPHGSPTAVAEAPDGPSRNTSSVIIRQEEPTESSVAGDEHATEGEGAAAEGEHGEEELHGYPGGRINEGELTGECGTPGFVPPDGEACFFPGLVIHEFQWINILPTLLAVLLGFALSAWVCVELYTRHNRRLEGLTGRSRPARAGYLFLWNKYYLDDLYEKVIVRSIAHPLARAMNWINQKVIDGVVNGAGRTGRAVGEMTYKYIDQGLVDGAVNGSGAAARNTGSALQPVQSGKVSQYGALLFAAAALGALVLVLVNT